MLAEKAELKQRQELEAKFIVKAWLDDKFKQELIRNPRAIFAKALGSSLPENIQILVLEETATTYYLVIPTKPEVSEELSEEALEDVTGGSREITTCINQYIAAL